MSSSPLVAWPPWGQYGACVGPRERLGFSAAGFGQNLVLNFVTLYLLTYLVEGLGLSVAGIAAATAILTAAKIWDAVADLLIGAFIDRTRTRWGRFRPYIIATAVPIALLTIALFHVPTAPEGTQLVWFGVCFVAWASVYTLSDVPYWSLTSVVSTDEQSRARLISSARTGGALALAAITSGGVPLARFLSFAPTTTAAGWGRASILAAVVGMGLFTLAFFTTTEKAPATPPLTLRRTLAVVAQNRSLLALLASGALGFGRFVLQVGGALIALILFGDEAWFTALGAALIVAMILAILATPALLKRWTRRAVMIWSSVASIAIYIVMALLGHHDVVVVVVIMFLQGLTFGVFMVTQTAMVADVADDGERLTGERNDGVCFAGLTLVSKLGGALATVAFGLTLTAIAYTRGVAITPEMQRGVWLAMTALPAISVAASLLPLMAYRVPERDLQRLLTESRAARSAA